MGEKREKNENKQITSWRRASRSLITCHTPHVLIPVWRGVRNLIFSKLFPPWTKIGSWSPNRQWIERQRKKKDLPHSTNGLLKAVVKRWIYLERLWASMRYKNGLFCFVFHAWLMRTEGGWREVTNSVKDLTRDEIRFAILWNTMVSRCTSEKMSRKITRTPLK